MFEPVVAAITVAFELLGGDRPFSSTIEALVVAASKKGERSI